MKAKIFGVLLLCIPLSSLALHKLLFAKAYQTTNIKPQDRSLTIYLPIAQMDEWIIANKNSLYAGTLTLTIMHDKTKRDIVVFANGKLNPGWTTYPLGSMQNKNNLATRFVSSIKVPTSPEDKLTLRLALKRAVFGIGPYAAGILPAGTYTAIGHYSGLLDQPNLKHSLVQQLATAFNGDEKHPDSALNHLYNRAFLANWDKQWSLVIINNQGWMSDPLIPYRINPFM